MIVLNGRIVIDLIGVFLGMSFLHSCPLDVGYKFVLVLVIRYRLRESIREFPGVSFLRSCPSDVRYRFI